MAYAKNTRIVSAETRARISVALTGGTRSTRGKSWEEIYGPEYSEKKRQAVKALMKGRVLSEITRKRLRESIRAGFAAGRISHFKGKTHSEEVRRKLAKAHYRRFCIHGHDTHKCGRNGNFCCRKCAAFQAGITNARRRAAAVKAKVGDAASIAKIYARARELKQWFNVVVDHIIPLVKGGTHEPQNLQIIYARENVRKSGKLNYVPQIIFK